MAARQSDRAGVQPGRTVVISTLGLGQILAWGSSYYLPAVLAPPIATDTGWPLPWIVAGLSIGSLTAGVIAPRVGRAIQAHGGRPVMALGAVLLALGLLGLSLAPSLPLHLLAWVVIGGGMGCSLYDAAFSTLGRLYGQTARPAITTLTLFGGFASTVCWPLSAFCLERLGWRGTCVAYAILHLGLTLPLYGLVLPSSSRIAAETRSLPSGGGDKQIASEPVLDRPWLVFALLATGISLGWAISSVISVHLLTILQATGFSLANAVVLGALVGPAQVSGRAVEMALGKYYRPIWTLVISVMLVASGLGLLLVSPSITAAALICYGAGIGIASIARGTLPLAIFGAERYPIWMGRLASPTLIAGAVSPALAAVLLERDGPTITLSVLEGLAFVNVSVALILLWLQKRE
jgi:predicted MFS family arabinose efflux permease